jgi:hypothetical protein
MFPAPDPFAWDFAWDSSAWLWLPLRVCGLRLSPSTLNGTELGCQYPYSFDVLLAVSGVCVKNKEEGGRRKEGVSYFRRGGTKGWEFSEILDKRVR